MSNYVSMQFSEVSSLKLTTWSVKFILDTTPWARQVMWYDRCRFFVTTISMTDSGKKRVGQMMLRSNEVSKHSRTKGTLVGNTYEVKHVTSLMIGEFRHNLMMHERGMRIGNEFTIVYITLVHA